MVLVLGIDTGGTFTDSVIFDLNSEKTVTMYMLPRRVSIPIWRPLWKSQ